MEELRRLEEEEEFMADRKKLNEFSKKQKKNIRESIDELHAKFILQKNNEGDYLVEDFVMANECIEFIKSNL
jgi:hypothetical protein